MARAAGLLEAGLSSHDQLAFARLVTDGARFAYLADVFVAPAERGRGLGRWLTERLTSLPQLQGARMLLGTRDAHGLYRGVGFMPLPAPERWMISRLNCSISRAAISRKLLSSATPDSIW